MCAKKSAEKLPEIVDVMQLVNAAERLSGEMSLSTMSRLLESTTNRQGDVFAELQFGTDIEGYAFIKGNLNTVVSLICQRCMDEMQFEINQAFLLSPVFSVEQAKHLPANYEAVLVDEQGRLSLHNLLEDEIILQLPIVAKHAEQNCADLRLAELGVTKLSQVKPNPFAALAALKRKEGN